METIILLVVVLAILIYLKSPLLYTLVMALPACMTYLLFEEVELVKTNSVLLQSLIPIIAALAVLFILFGLLWKRGVFKEAKEIKGKEGEHD